MCINWSSKVSRKLHSHDMLQCHAIAIVSFYCFTVELPAPHSSYLINSGAFLCVQRFTSKISTSRGVSALNECNKWQCWASGEHSDDASCQSSSDCQTFVLYLALQGDCSSSIPRLCNGRDIRHLCVYCQRARRGIQLCNISRAILFDSYGWSYRHFGTTNLYLCVSARFRSVGWPLGDCHPRHCWVVCDGDLILPCAKLAWASRNLRV